MWQRFTERARKVVFYAQEEAAKFGEGYVSTEHLLLGLIKEPSPSVQAVLSVMGVTPARIRAEVERQLPRGDSRKSQDMTLTPRAKRVIDLAYDETKYDDAQYLHDYHILLGLIREGDGLAGRVLAKLGFELIKCREFIAGASEAETAQTSYEVEPTPLAYTTTVQTDAKIEDRAKEVAVKIGQAMSNRVSKDDALTLIRLAKLEAIEAVSDIFDELSLAVHAL